MSDKVPIKYALIAWSPDGEEMPLGIPNPNPSHAIVNTYFPYAQCPSAACLM